MVRLSTLLGGLTLLGAAAASAVVDLVPDNFDDVVLKSGKPALVEFFAPWCGHCKNLAPVYEELAGSYAHAGEKLTIAKVDADDNRSLGQRFGVQGFPTLKWFDGKSETPEDYKGGRDLESLQNFVKEKTGVKAKTKAKAPSEVVMLDDKSFKESVGSDKDVFVAFTAPWCGREYIPRFVKMICYSRRMDADADGCFSFRLQEPRPHLGNPRPGLQARAQRHRRQGRRRSPQRQGYRAGPGRQVVPDHQVLPQGQHRADRLRWRPLRGGFHFVPQREDGHPPRARRRPRRHRRHHRGPEQDRRGVQGLLGQGRQGGQEGSSER